MRRPARLERAGALTPRDRMWAAIRALGVYGAAFSSVEIEFAAEQQPGAVKSYLRALAAGAFLREVSRVGPRSSLRLRQFALERDVGVEAPRVNEKGELVTQGRSQQQMWNVLRKQKGTFDWRGVVAEASTEECRIERTAAISYLRELARAGYLIVAEKGASGSPGHGNPTTYRFFRSRNTGPRPPLVCRDGSVMDGNTGKEMAPAGRPQ